MRATVINIAAFVLNYVIHRPILEIKLHTDQSEV